MTFLIVSKAPLITETPRISPTRPSFITPRIGVKYRNKSKPKISLSLDTLILTERCDKYDKTNTCQVKTKRKRKARKSQSISRCNQIECSPQKVSNNSKYRTSPYKRDPNKPNFFTPNINDTSQSIIFSPDRIIKRAISNIMCRSATKPLSTPTTSNSIQQLVSTYSGTDKPPRTSPSKSLRINTSFLPYTSNNLSHQNVPLRATHRKKVFLSDQHNPGVAGQTAGRIPPLNSPLEVSHSIELVPSLGDARSQVSLQKELRNLEAKRLAISLAQNEKIRAENEKRAGESKLRAKSQFRSEVYALNKVMRQLEENKFNDSQSSKV